jgi:hypothetical protein
MILRRKDLRLTEGVYEAIIAIINEYRERPFNRTPVSDLGFLQNMNVKSYIKMITWVSRALTGVADF